MKNLLDVNRAIRPWKNLLIVTAITTITFFVISYDFFLSIDLYLYLLLLIGIIITLIFFVIAINTIFTFKQLPSKWLIIFPVILIISMPLNYCYNNGVFWGKKIIEAAFLDDRSRMDLTLFENGHFLINSNWLFGNESFHGTYHLHSDTIVFNHYPVVDNDFVSKKIVRKNSKIYFRQDNLGAYDTSFYYFQIDFDKKHNF